LLLTIGLVFIGLVILMVLGVPVGLCFAAGAIILLYAANVDPLWAIQQAFQLQQAYTFLALPLYVLLGSILSSAGMADRICEFAQKLVGRIRGGLGIAIVIANGIFGAMSGSALSALGGMGRAFLPVMEKQGYPKSYAVALLIPSAVLSCLIPPSGYLILLAFLGQLSIAKAFLAGVGPGITLMIFLIITHLIMASRIKSIEVPEKLSFKEQVKTVGSSAYRNSLTLAIPVVVLGVIYGGFGTPTESASIGTIYAFIIATFVYRKITFKKMAQDVKETGTLIGSLLVLLFFFFVLSRILVIERVSEDLLALMLSISTNKWILMLMINILMLLMGMIMDDVSTAIITTTVLFPLATSIGFNAYHFVAIATVNLEMGMITPPVAPLLYLGGHIAGNMPLSKYIKPVFWFMIGAFLPTLLLVMFVPEISTLLPTIFARKG